jgi:hypothetical protein
VGALTASAALVATTAATTGAYFSDSKDGSFTATAGHLTLDLNHPTQTTMNFTDLWPGTNQDKTVDYKIDASSDGVDLWLTFDPNSKRYQQLTGGKASPLVPDGGMGRYGYFAVSDSHVGQAFQSGNLSFANGNNDPTTNGCSTGTDGRGGSGAVATPIPGRTDLTDPHNWTTPPYCGIPAQILLASDLTKNDSGTVTLTFGLGAIQSQQNQAEFSGGSVPFKLVATQHGQRP